VKYNQWIDFNGEWASTKTVEAFIAHEKHHGLSERELRDIHALILIEHGDNTGAEKEDVIPENLIEHGDNIGVQKESVIPEDAGSSGGSNKRKRRKPADPEPGTDDGGEA
jgi:hypothetical protein